MNALEWLYARADEKWRQQWADIDNLYSKVNVFLGACGILVVLFGALLVNKMWLAGLAGSIFTVVAFSILLSAYKPIDWQIAPNIERLIEHLDCGSKIEQLLEDGIRAAEEAYLKNEKQMDQIAAKINCASILIMIALFASLAGLIMGLFCRA